MKSKKIFLKVEARLHEDKDNYIITIPNLEKELKVILNSNGSITSRN